MCLYGHQTTCTRIFTVTLPITALDPFPIAVGTNDRESQGLKHHQCAGPQSRKAAV